MIRFGVITNNIYGIVIFLKIIGADAPSILAASYNSPGIFCRIPVVDNMVKGTPIQILIQMITILAIVASVKNGMDSVDSKIPICRNIILTGPLALKMVLF